MQRVCCFLILSYDVVDERSMHGTVRVQVSPWQADAEPQF
jgi:hypothetical protein